MSHRFDIFLTKYYTHSFLLICEFYDSFLQLLAFAMENMKKGTALSCNQNYLNVAFTEILEW